MLIAYIVVILLVLCCTAMCYHAIKTESSNERHYRIGLVAVAAILFIIAVFIAIVPYFIIS